MPRALVPSLALAAAVSAAGALPLAAQEQEPPRGPNEEERRSGAAGALDKAMKGNLSSAASQATKRLKEAGENAILIGDLLGAEVSGPGGETIGTVENFVLVPGGRLVAVLIETEEGERTPVPYAAVSVTRTANAVGVTLPVTLEQLKGEAALNALGRALPL